MSDFDQPDFYCATIPRARVSRTCCECGATIRAGRRYHRASGKWDGTVQSFSTCLPCNRLRETLAKERYDGEGVFGGLADEAEHDRSPAARRFMIRREASRRAKEKA